MRFSSLSNPQIGYIVDKEYRFGMVRDQEAVRWGKQYETYSDGLTQHSPAYPIRVNQLGDFLVSLATHLEKYQEETEIIERLWPSQSHLMPQKKILFFHYLKHKEDKTTYYSAEEGKVSSSPSKRHDKRWEEIPKWCEGSQNAWEVYQLAFTYPLKSDYRDTVEQYTILSYIRSIIAEESNWYCEHPIQTLQISEEPWNSSFDSAFQAVFGLVESYRSRERAKRALGNYLRNTQAETREEEEIHAASSENATESWRS